MGYRFLKIQSTDYTYIEPFLRRHPEHKYLPYDELYDLYVRSCCGWNTNYSSNLASLGYKAEDICIDFEFLQKLWANEHGIRYNERSWLREIVSAQIKAFQPDILFLDDLYFFDAAFRQFLRDTCPKPVKIVGWRASPTEDYRLFKDVDLMLTCTPLFADQMRDEGANAELIMHAFEPMILNMVDQRLERDLDFTFVGNFVLRDGFHNERLALVKSLMSSTNLEVWGGINEPRKRSLRKRMVSKLKKVAQKPLERIGVSANALATLRRIDQLERGPEATSMMQDYKDRFHEPVLALEYFKILTRSKINLNKHIDCAENYAGNIRLFEATGMGACLVTDWKVNLPQMFEPDVEVITYSSTEECAEKVRYLLSHENQLQSIANAGQRRTLRDHSYQRRAEQLDEILRHLLAGSPSGPRGYSMGYSGKRVEE